MKQIKHLEIEKYKIGDNTYKSPKNGKIYKGKKSITAHLSYAGTTNPKAFAERLYDVQCNFCKKEYKCSVIKQHEKCCYLNPKNIKLCEVCNKPIKNFKTSKGTCSYSCSNKFFKHLRNKPERYTKYTTICWQNHKKECVVCGETKIVAVHHLNENHEDNRPENLIPLCPTHHSYIHSKYKNEVLPKVNEYIKDYQNR